MRTQEQGLWILCVLHSLRVPFLALQRQFSEDQRGKLGIEFVSGQISSESDLANL